MAHFKYFLLFTLLVVLSSSSCEKRLSCSRNWSFEVPIYVTNVKSTYNIGDTLIFESEFGIEYTDLESGDKVIMTEFPFDFGFILTKIDENPWWFANQNFELIQFKNQFDFVSIPTNGRPGQGGAFMTTYIKEDEQNLLKFGLVSKNSGVFTIEFFASAGPDRERARADFTDDCSDYVDPFQIRMNDRDENGFNLYNGSIDTTLHSVTREVYDKNGVYSFVVE